jgi:hypothetical protein
MTVSSSSTLPSGTRGNVLVSNTATITLNLPIASYTGQTITFKDVLGNGGDFPITLDAPGSITIGGQLTQVIDTAFGVLTICWDGAEWEILYRFPPDMGDIRPQFFRIPGDGTNIAADRLTALVNRLNATGSTTIAARIPPVTGRPLTFPPGRYKAATPQELSTWGTGATIRGYGMTSVLENIGINIGQWRDTEVFGLCLCPSDLVVVPGNNGFRTDTTGGLWSVHDNTVMYKDIGLWKTNLSLLLANTRYFNNRHQFCRVGAYIEGGFSPLFYGNQIASSAEVGFEGYGIQGFRSCLNDIVGSGIVNQRIRGGTRRGVLECYWGYNQVTSGGRRSINLVNITNDAGFARFETSTAINATAAACPSIMLWDPVRKHAYAYFSIAGSAGSVDTVVINGVNILPAPVLFATSANVTAQNVAAAINAAGGAYTAVAPGSGRFLVDASTVSGTTPVGQVVSATGTTLTVTPNPCVELTYASPHGIDPNAILNEEDIEWTATEAVVIGSANATVLTVDSVLYGTVAVGNPVTGETFASHPYIQSFGTGSGGAGTYNLTSGIGVQPTQQFNIGSSGLGKIRYVSAPDKIILELRPDIITPTGVATRPTYWTIGRNGLNLTTNLQTSNNITVTSINTTGMTTTIPFGDITPGWTTASISMPIWDLDLGNIDGPGNSVQDQFFIGGNYNYIRIRNGYNIRFFGSRLKTIIYVDYRIDPMTRPNEILFTNPRGRLDPAAELDADTDTAAIIGTNQGWKEIKNTVKYRTGVPHYGDDLMLNSPSMGSTLTNYQPKLNQVKVDHISASMVISDIIQMTADVFGFALPNLPTANPLKSGYLWDNAGTVMRSAG